VTTPATAEFGAVNKTSSNRAGITLMNDQVGHVIAEVMKDKPGVTITYLPSMIRVDADTRMDFVYDELAEALGEEAGSFTSADLEESMSTHYGRMVHEDDRTIMFANPEDAAEYLGFDLKALATPAG
jgi:propane monooxygenase coupling protein